MKTWTHSFFVYSLLVIALFGTTMTNSAQRRQMGGAGITVFNDPNFRGKSSTFRQDVPNLPYFLRNRVSSLRPVVRQPR